jgi:hypothetical protein
MSRVCRKMGPNARRAPKGVAAPTAEAPDTAGGPLLRKPIRGHAGFCISLLASRGCGRSYTALARGYVLRRESITPRGLEQNRMIERVIRTLKERPSTGITGTGAYLRCSPMPSSGPSDLALADCGAAAACLERAGPVAHAAGCAIRAAESRISSVLHRTTIAMSV